MIRTLSWLVFLLAISLAQNLPCLAQKQAAAEEEKPGDELVVKVYRVLDLVTAAPDYPYEGTYLPNAHANPVGTGSGSSRGMGGMGGGMGGMGGGMGMMQVADRAPQTGGRVGGGGMPTVARGGSEGPSRRPSATQINMSQLINVITSIVEPASWDEVGGEGSIAPIGGALAIRQTPAIQSKVQDFLTSLKRESGTLRTLTIHARWLMLDGKQLAQLKGDAVSREALAALPEETQRYAGQITCLNGQTVHIVSGRLESAVSGAIPVVGGGTDVGYQPIVLMPHLGVLLQVTPSVLPGDDGVLVDVHNWITRWDEPPSPFSFRGKSTSAAGKSSVQLDRLKATAQQFDTSLRMPLDKPVIAGGITFPGREPDEQEGQLYLVIEVHSGPQPDGRHE